MKLKITAAALTALSIIPTASLTACGLLNDPMYGAETNAFGDINGDGKIDAKDASLILSYYSYVSTSGEDAMSLEEFVYDGKGDENAADTTTAKTDKPEETTTTTAAPDKPALKTSLGTDGDTFTVVSWNPEDVPYLIANWLNIGEADIRNGKPVKTPDGVNVEFVSFNTYGGDAMDRYDNIFNSGNDIDVYLVEPDWALQLLNDDSRSAPMSAIAIDESDTEHMYPYTLDQGRDSNGVLKALAWDASPGCFAYRADLAEAYLGVKSPDEMQAAIGSWQLFTQAAETVASKTKGKVALADSVGGMWDAYKSGLSSPLVIGGRPVISDEIKDFADMAKKLWDCGGVLQAGQWTDDWTEAGIKGTCMGYFTPAWGFSKDSFLMNAAEDSYGKWAVCEGPAPYWWGGSMLALNPATDNAVEAHSFIVSSVIDRGNLYKFASQSAYLPNSTDMTKLLIDDNFVPDESVSGNLGGQNYLEILDRNAKAIDLTWKITEYDSAIAIAMLSGIEYEYLRNGESWEYTVDYMKDHIEASCPTLIID